MFKFGFCDLNVNVLPSEPNAEKIYRRIAEAGFRTIAINRVLAEMKDEQTTKKKKGEKKDINSLIPPPICVSEIKALQGINVLTRLTIPVSDPTTLHKLKNVPNFSKYDLIAVIPLSTTIFNAICQVNFVDIICPQNNGSVPLGLNRKVYKAAVGRQVYFEIPYVPATYVDSTSRKSVISSAHYYYTLGRSKNVVVTSWAKFINDIYGPYDVIHLSLLFGLNHIDAKRAITKTCHDLINRAALRKRGRSHITSVSPVTSTEDEEYSRQSENPSKKMKTDTANVC